MKNKTCPDCGSENTVWRGWRYNRSGKKHLQLCNDCGRKFTPDDGFLRMRNKPRHIVIAVDLHRSGLSLQQVKNHLWQHYGVSVSRPTILEWVRKYSKLIEDFVGKQKPEIKGNVHADEVIVKVKGKKKYYWGAKDRKTKYKLAKKLTHKRDKFGAKNIFKKLKHNCKGRPPKIITDKLGQYRRAYNKYFYRTETKLVHGVPIACKKYGLEHNNNCIERDNERIKGRYKTMRGFNGFKSAQDILFLIDNCHNYIDPHPELGWKTPAEVAGIDLQLGRKKLLNLIHIFHSTHYNQSDIKIGGDFIPLT